DYYPGEEGPQNENYLFAIRVIRGCSSSSPGSSLQLLQVTSGQEVWQGGKESPTRLDENLWGHNDAGHGPPLGTGALAMTRYPGLLGLLLFLFAASARSQGPAEAIYHGGDIVTVDVKNPSAEALAVKGGKIVAVGKKADVLKLKGDSTKVIDLGGKTLVPGFLDGHSHFINS